METLRKEHDCVFGTDVAAAPGILCSNAQLINQLPYTSAVIKEAMRLFPPASSMRDSLEVSNSTIKDDCGGTYPVDGFYICVSHLAIQRNPKYWPQLNDFIPERWLVGPEDALHPSKGACRPFEFGPRSCIGQTLVLADVKTVLVMTMREFDIQDAYGEWDKTHPMKNGSINNVRGERAYLIEKGGGHPADGYPCRVSLRHGS